jgi:patatin-like phospholipase/acyl hydrolase
VNSDLILPDSRNLDRVPAPFQILCLSGGGYRGLYSASILEKLEERADGKPLWKVFDLIAGTSIGGILALGLAAGLKASRLRELFEEHGDRIFPRYYKIKGKSVLPRVHAGLINARYPQAGLRAAIEAILNEAGGPKVLSDLKTGVLISSVDVTDRAPRLFRSADLSCKTSLVDIALATSAAPTYFPEHSVGDNIVVDGGLIANAPDMVAVLYALKIARLEDLRVLSIGTAGAEGAKAVRKAERRGALTGGKSVFFLTLDAQEQLSVDCTKNLLSEHYIRLDIIPSEDERSAVGLDLTNRKAAATLGAMAQRTMNEKIPPQLAQFREMLNRSWCP